MLCLRNFKKPRLRFTKDILILKRTVTHSSDDSAISKRDKQLLGLEGDFPFDPKRDPRSQSDFSKIRVPGPKKQMQSNKNDQTERLLFNRAGIEKKHVEWGWSPKNDRTGSQWNWRDNQRPLPQQKQDKEAQQWPNELQLLSDDKKDKNEKGPPTNFNDLTTFESFSNASRSATFKTALNLGVHWGDYKSEWNQSMGPYLKGVVHKRHVFDLSLTISSLRKMIRLLQSLIMDRCQILFVANGKDHDLRTITKVMFGTLAGDYIHVLDSRWIPGSISNWNHVSEHYRGPGREISNGKRPSQFSWSRTKLHRDMQTPPDFIFLMNRRENDILVHEANRMAIPVAALCDSSDSTRDLQYIIPCNTHSLQAVHWVLDQMRRGIIEAQSKMDSGWWAGQQDRYDTRNALHDAEVEWQYKYDPYEQQRHAKTMVAGNLKDFEIPINYKSEDEVIGRDATFATNLQPQPIKVSPWGTPEFWRDSMSMSPQAFASGAGSGIAVETVENSRMDAHSKVDDSQEWKIKQNSGEMNIDSHEFYLDDRDKHYNKVPLKLQSGSDFCAKELLLYAKRKQMEEKPKIHIMHKKKKL